MLSSLLLLEDIHDHQGRAVLQPIFADGASLKNNYWPPAPSPVSGRSRNYSHPKKVTGEIPFLIKEQINQVEEGVLAAPTVTFLALLSPTPFPW
jgi:hypothetical protein